jgi:putative hydrolase of the HAD superfamily
MDINKKANKSKWIVVFDLDDTLYKETDYNLSGVISVANNLEKLFNKNIQNDLIKIFEDKGDVWGEACKLLSLPLSVKESLLWMYRLHCPEIALEEEVESLLSNLTISGNPIIILSDGRSITQRLKLLSLNLINFPTYISEDYSSIKPNEKRFKLIMQDHICDNYVYVADNPNKDFIAPNNLGWKTICLNCSDQNIHTYEKNKLKEIQNPDVWIDRLIDLTIHLN